MKIAIMQPYTFPYIGYFQLINAVDTFIFYDDVNFIKKGFINRNSILVNKKRHQFVIPCRDVSQNKQINQIHLSFDEKARRKFLRSITLAYKKAPYYESIFPLLEAFFLDISVENISDFAIDSVKIICKYLDISTQFKQSSENYADSINLGKTERLITICKDEKATVYINPIGGIELYDKSDFDKHGLSLLFQESIIVPYKQFDHDFVTWLSIMDVLMFNSKEEVLEMLKAFELR